MDKNFSLTAFEYFDYVTDKAALTMERNGVKSLLLFDYNTDELFDIKGNLSLILCMLQKFFQEHIQSVKQFGSRSGPTFSSSRASKILSELNLSVRQFASRSGPTLCQY